ncbi:AAA family ATPase [Aneurinibacillus aneurinilyticus]|uniref:AAA family ATPase n=1 Tax=Aneurinibacillus aneurinilyticus TaxID=1391 RepID=UPI002E2126E0|nr:AAA family ATPase [Aneurinibacillus aneurinilyticus]MED0672120.1 AAA family ATPase [Aneurinibacillus aneurinilyticus]
MSVEALIPKLIRASLENDFRTVRSLAIRMVRQVKNTHPKVAEEIAQALEFHGVGVSTRRSIGIEDSPLDNESRLSLASVEEPIECKPPILSKVINESINDFVNERKNSKKLLSAGLIPASSILLYGPPGVGKTYLAKYLSGIFNLKFVTLDLATCISSYLGKTGQNLKSVLNYAREEPTLLLLDEFDAVAKKRDDMSDLGELKRIVNVLLKELEDWPPHSILMAATNHPDLLDPAIWRRFDRVIEIKLPKEEERLEILKRELSDFPRDKNTEAFYKLIANLSSGLSGADLCKLSDRVKRKAILYDGEPMKIVLQELISLNRIKDSDFNKKFCKLAREYTDLSIRELAGMLGKSHSTVQYYLKGE